MSKDNLLKKLKLPTENELKELSKKRREDLKININCMSIWLPLISDLNINIPKTKLIHFPLEEYEDDCFKIFEKRVTSNKLLDFEKKLIKEVKTFGTPCFMKSGTFSSKHDWGNTCFIRDEKEAFKNWLNIMHNSLMYGASGSHYIVLRELIDTDKKLYAFNELPITKERRYFFEEKKVTMHHPYWPESSLKGNIKKENWQKILKKINHESKTEIKLLEELSLDIGNRLNKIHPNWSIDWLQDKKGKWWLIDVAVKEQSYIWKDYPYLTKGLLNKRSSK